MTLSSFKKPKLIVLKASSKVQVESKDESEQNKEKDPLKSSQVECFNYRGKWHSASNCLTPKKNKKFMKIA